MEKRVLFRSAWLPWVLLAPQLAVISIFFFWPAGEAIWYSFIRQDAFGISKQFVWFENYQALFSDPGYLKAFINTAVFSTFVCVFSLSIALLFAVFIFARPPFAKGAMP